MDDTTSPERARDVVATTRATYDAIGDAYAEANREMPESVVLAMERFFASLPVASPLVADVGCGTGRDLAELRARGAEAFGFDLSTGMLRAAGQEGLVQADMTMLPIRSDSLDGVWCAAAFLHVPRELCLRALADFRRVLRPGGVLHLAVSEGAGEGFEPDAYGSSRERWFVHHSRDELVGRLVGLGLEVTSVTRSESRRTWLTIGATLVEVAHGS